jgi:hypothetical protein
MFIKKKRASLEISIQAIIIIVLAMTFVGLGLGFVKGLFKNITETTGSVQEQVKQQILEDLRTGDKKLSFPTAEVIIEKQASKVLAVGVKNTESAELEFNIIINKINDGDGSRAEVAGTDGTFIYSEGDQKLGINDARVYPIRYTAPDTAKTLIFEVNVCKTSGVADGGCGTVGTRTAIGPTYDSKTFFVTVT